MGDDYGLAYRVQLVVVVFFGSIVFIHFFLGDKYFSMLSSPTEITDMIYFIFILIAIGLFMIAFLLGVIFIIGSLEQRAISKLKLGDKISFNRFGEGTYIGPSEIKPFIKVQFPDGEIRDIDVFGRSAL